MRTVSKLIVFLGILPWSTVGLTKDGASGFNLSFGTVYPDMSLAPRENPAVLCIGGMDRLSVMHEIPGSYDSKNNILSIGGKDDPQNPTYLSYTGNPKPFGIGASLSTGKDANGYAALSFGTDTIQLGYSYHLNPQTHINTNTYSVRLGPADGNAINILWGQERKVLGIGLAKGWFVADLDLESDLNFTSDPTASLAFGIQTEIFGINYGLKGNRFKPFSLNNFSRFAGLFFKVGKSFVVDVYYQRFISEFSGGLTWLI